MKYVNRNQSIGRSHKNFNLFQMQSSRAESFNNIFSMLDDDLEAGTEGGSTRPSSGLSTTLEDSGVSTTG